MAKMQNTDTTRASNPNLGDYGEEGVGNSASPFVEATRTGMFPNGNMGGNRSQGETPGAGSIYAVMLNERPNRAKMDRGEPSREPSISASSPIPIASVDDMKTGRLR